MGKTASAADVRHFDPALVRCMERVIGAAAQLRVAISAGLPDVRDG
jgi:hypothetical protein